MWFYQLGNVVGRKGNCLIIVSAGMFPFRTSLNAPVSDDAASLVRCVPGEDRTNGFFVACFVKTMESLARTGVLKSSRAVIDEHHSNRPRKKQRLDSF